MYALVEFWMLFQTSIKTGESDEKGAWLSYKILKIQKFVVCLYECMYVWVYVCM